MPAGGASAAGRGALVRQMRPNPETDWDKSILMSRIRNLSIFILSELKENPIQQNKIRFEKNRQPTCLLTDKAEKQNGPSAL